MSYNESVVSKPQYFNMRIEGNNGDTVTAGNPIPYKRIALSYFSRNLAFYRLSDYKLYCPFDGIYWISAGMRISVTYNNHLSLSINGTMYPSSIVDNVVSRSLYWFGFLKEGDVVFPTPSAGSITLLDNTSYCHLQIRGESC